MQNAITILEVLAVLAILFAFATLATRDTELLKEAPPDDPDVELPVGPLQPEDVGAVRFGMVLRGYRMREVDDVLTRVAADLIARDQRIAELEQALVEVVEPQVEAAEQGLITPAAEPVEVQPEPPVFADLALPVLEDAAPAMEVPAAAPPAPTVSDLDVSEPEPALAGPGSDNSADEPVADSVMVEPVLEEPVVATPAAEPADPAAPSEPIAAEDRTPEVEPAPVPEPAPEDLPVAEPAQELPHWPQPALEPEPEPLVPDDLAPEPSTDLTAPVDDTAFSAADDFPEVKSADDE